MPIDVGGREDQRRQIAGIKVTAGVTLDEMNNANALYVYYKGKTHDYWNGPNF